MGDFGGREMVEPGDLGGLFQLVTSWEKQSSPWPHRAPKKSHIYQQAAAADRSHPSLVPSAENASGGGKEGELHTGLNSLQVHPLDSSYSFSTFLLWYILPQQKERSKRMACGFPGVHLALIFLVFFSAEEPLLLNEEISEKNSCGSCSFKTQPWKATAELLASAWAKPRLGLCPSPPHLQLLPWQRQHRHMLRGALSLNIV